MLPMQGVQVRSLVGKLSNCNQAHVLQLLSPHLLTAKPEKPGRDSEDSVQPNIHTYTYIHIHTHTFTHKHTHTYTHIHTYIRTYIHNTRIGWEAISQHICLGQTLRL